VEGLKYLATTLKNQISIPGVIKISSKLGNACCNSVQNFVFQQIQKLEYTEFSFCFFMGMKPGRPH
jgi:hypothetical protein